MIVKPGSRHRALVVALAAIYGMGSQVAHANPTGAQVVNGQAAVQAQGNRLTVTNTPGAIINWQSFSIGAGETTYFQQQSATSAVLNRVQAQNPALKSQIDGTLGSNGRVFLINPNGIVFGPNSLIDTQGFVASTLGLNDEDFKQGRFRFAREGAAGGIQAQGRISSGNGDVYLVAPNIGVDGTAVITSRGGNIVLAAGEMVEITGRNLNDITFAIQSKDNQAINLGTLSGGAVGVFAGTLNHSGVVQAQTLANEGGRLVLKALGNATLGAGSTTRADGQTLGGNISIASASGNVVLDTGAQVSAQALAAAVPLQAPPRGGDIRIDASAGYVAVERDALVSASGGRGGSITVQAGQMVQDGAIRADGSTSLGGSVGIHAGSRLIQTASALVSAQGVLRGGAIDLSVDAGSGGHLFTSGTLDASASTGMGGTIDVTGHDLVLAAARLQASGDSGGGAIRVGGGRGGQDGDIANAQNIVANGATRLVASARVDGDGGTVVAWANGTNQFAGTLEARGGAEGGNGGFIEVSGKEATQFGGMANAGAPHGRNGTFLLDPKFITIQAPVFVPGVNIELLDPNPGAGDLFGSNASVLSSTGNILLFDSSDDFGGLTNAGAIYLYDGMTGALLSNLRGGTAGDQIGSGGIVRFLGTSNVLISSPSWSGNAGALTTFNATTGVSGTLSSANSLVGAAPGDQIGSSGISSLAGGKLAVFSPNWNSAAGAITWIDGTNGLTGVVSSGNSLVGALPNDRVGNSGISSLGSGKYYVATAAWNGSAGAVTWIDSAAPLTGVLGSGNSLVGGTPADQVGVGGIYDLGGGKMLVFSPNWNGNMGAVTWFDKAAGTSGVVGAGNSLVGSTAGDRVGSGYWDFEGSLFAILSPDWNNAGTAAAAGAITWASTSTALTAAVSAGNSLVGSTPNDRVGNNGLGYLGGINAVVVTPTWNGDTGAVTWINGAAPLVGAISSSNSLVGAAPGDQVGRGGVEFIGSNKALVFSPDWANGTATSAGAVTWFDTAAGATFGVVGVGNSLVGSRTNDQVGGFGDFQDFGSKIAIFSPNFNGTSASDIGAITWADATAGITGAVGVGNSLIGTFTNDRVGDGGLTYLNGTNYAVLTPTFNTNAGAVTWIDGAAPQTGTINSNNSLLGSVSGDRVGSGGLQDLFLGNNRGMVFSPNWNGNRGAVTWFNFLTGTFGTVDATNSLVGSTAGDLVGNGYYDYVGSKIAIFSPNWNNGGTAAQAGAVTWVDALTGSPGVVSAANSLVGSSVNDRVGNSGLTYLDGVRYVVESGSWSANAGAITWINSAAPTVGAVSSTNSLVGALGGDGIGNFGFNNLGNGKSLVLSPGWNGNMGAATWFDNVNGTFGVVGAANSLVGSTGGTTTTGDRVGATYQNLGSTIALRSPNWNNGTDTLAGAVTFADAFTGLTGAVSASNSLVGSHVNDRVGNNSLQQFFFGSNYYLTSNAWNSNAGAVTWINPGAPPIGVLDSSNSLVGASASDQVGSSGTYNVGSGKSLVFSPNWNGNMGAVTWFDQAAGTTGVVGAGNSLVGSTAGDQVGSGFYSSAGSKLAILSPNWNNGGTAAAAGAVTWFDAGVPMTGAVSAANSLVGTSANDRVGNGGFSSLGGNLYMMRSANWNGNAGALTWINSVAPLVGQITSANSLVGASPGHGVGGASLSFGTGYAVLRNTSWNGNRGAVTWIDTAAPLTGVVSEANSLVGGTANDRIGQNGVGFLANGDYYVRSSTFNGGAGAVTVGSAEGGISGLVSSLNSLVGQTALDGYGGSVTVLSGSRLLVRVSAADGSGLSDSGRVHIYSGGSAGGDGALGQTYAANPGSSVTITPGQITAITNSGTDVVLQANTDITLAALSDIVTNNPAGNGGDLTLQAGRSIFLNANITTDNGNLTLIANDGTMSIAAANSLAVSTGVSAADRDPGTAMIVMADGTRIDAGTGTVDIQMRDGVGHAGAQDTASLIQLRSITAAALSVKNDFGAIQIGDLAATLPSDIKISGDASLDAGTKVLVTGGAPGAFAQLAADGQITIKVPTAADLVLNNGRSSARIVNPPRTKAIDLICLFCLKVSNFEFTGPGAGSSALDAITASLLSLNPNYLDQIEDTKESKGEIEIEVEETCK